MLYVSCYHAFLSCCCVVCVMLHVCVLVSCVVCVMLSCVCVILSCVVSCVVFVSSRVAVWTGGAHQVRASTGWPEASDVSEESCCSAIPHPTGKQAPSAWCCLSVLRPCSRAVKARCSSENTGASPISVLLLVFTEVL